MLPGHLLACLPHLFGVPAARSVQSLAVAVLHGPAPRGAEAIQARITSVQTQIHGCTMHRSSRTGKTRPCLPPLPSQSRVLSDQTQGHATLEACKIAYLAESYGVIRPSRHVRLLGAANARLTRPEHASAGLSWVGPCPLPAPLGTFVVRDRLPCRMH